MKSSTSLTHHLKFGFIIALAATFGLHAQEVDNAASKYVRSLSLGASLTDGNSETMLANGSFLLTGEKDSLGSFKTGLEGNYGENKVREVTVAADGSETEKKRDEKTVANAKAYAEARKTLTDMTFASLNGSIVHDGIAEINYRAMVGPGLGMYLLKDDQRKLSVEAGVEQVWEEVDNHYDDYLALRFAEAGEYKFGTGGRIWQSIEYLPEASDFENYLINAELGVEAPLQGAMSLRVVLQDKYDNQPGVGLDRNDLALIAGISIKL